MWPRVLWVIGSVTVVFFTLSAGQFAFAKTAEQQTAPLNGITGPTAEEVIAGVVLVQGSATHPDFLRYEIALYKEFDPYTGWIVFADGAQPVISDTLAVWDTTIGKVSNAPAFPDGLYRLRLRVVRRDYNYDEYFVTNILLSNDSATPTPTLTPTATIDPLATPTRVGEAAVLGTATAVPELLPSLTPFPTPSPPAIATTSGPTTTVQLNQPSTNDPVRDLVSQTQNLDTSPFLSAMQIGAQLALVGFGLLAFYLIARAVGRWVWLKGINKLSNRQK